MAMFLSAMRIFGFGNVLVFALLLPLLAVSIRNGELCRNTEKNITTANLWHDKSFQNISNTRDGYDTIYCTTNSAC